MSDALSEVGDVSVDAAFVLDRAGDPLAKAAGRARHGRMDHILMSLKTATLFCVHIVHICILRVSVKGEISEANPSTPAWATLMLEVVPKYRSSEPWCTAKKCVSRQGPKRLWLRPSSWHRSSPFRGNASAACRPLSRSTLQASRRFLCKEEL